MKLYTNMTSNDPWITSHDPKWPNTPSQNLLQKDGAIHEFLTVVWAGIRLTVKTSLGGTTNSVRVPGHVGCTLRILQSINNFVTFKRLKVLR